MIGYLGHQYTNLRNKQSFLSATIFNAMTFQNNILDCLTIFALNKKLVLIQ